MRDAGAGNLAASLWKFGDEESGWRYRFNIFRMARANGRVSHRLLPHDVADLAKLAQTLAFALSEEECLDRELRDDLRCLFACLSDVFPSALDNEVAIRDCPTQRSLCFGPFFLGTSTRKSDISGPTQSPTIATGCCC